MKWSRENYYHNLSSPYCLRLASGDASGKIIVWDVVSGTAHCEIQEHSKPIQGKRSCKKAERGHFPGSTFKGKLWTVVSHLFSLRCSYHHSLPFPWRTLRFHPPQSHILLSVLLSFSARLGVAVESGCITRSAVGYPPSQLHCSVERRHGHQAVEKELRWEHPLLFFWPLRPLQYGV